jgi:hypothetical protein
MALIATDSVCNMFRTFKGRLKRKQERKGLKTLSLETAMCQSQPSRYNPLPYTINLAHHNGSGNHDIIFQEIELWNGPGSQYRNKYSEDQLSDTSFAAVLQKLNRRYLLSICVF